MPDENGERLAFQCAAFSYNEDGDLVDPDRDEIAELIRDDRARIAAQARAEALDQVVRVLRLFQYAEWELGPNERLGDGSPDVIGECIKRIEAIRALGSGGEESA